MSAEKLRRFVIGRLSYNDASPEEFVSVLDGIVDPEEAEELVAWLERRPYRLSLDEMAGAIADALNAVCGERFTGRNIREFLSDIQNGV